VSFVTQGTDGMPEIRSQRQSPTNAGSEFNVEGVGKMSVFQLCFFKDFHFSFLLVKIINVCLIKVIISKIIQAKKANTPIILIPPNNELKILSCDLSGK